MLRLRNQAVSNRQDFASVAEQLSITIRNGIIRLKQLSRLSGYNQANKELVSVDNDYVPLSISFYDYSLDDVVLARKYANNFSRLWLSKATKDSFRESARAANRDSLYRLNLIGTTESSKAFNEGRKEACLLYDGHIELFKVWDATLDINTCHYCGSNHGELVPISEKFSFGEPGFLHPNCCCTFSIITSEELKSKHSL